MVNNPNYRQGPVRSVTTKPIASAVVIKKGDLLYQDIENGDVFPASSLADNQGELANQELFSCWFIGVALEQSISGATKEIEVATDAEFEFTCPSGTWNLGDLVGVDTNAAGTALLDQTVEYVVAPSQAIGKIARYEGIAVTKVWVRIYSRVFGYGLDTPTCQSSSSGV